MTTTKNEVTEDDEVKSIQINRLRNRGRGEGPPTQKPKLVVDYNCQNLPTEYERPDSMPEKGRRGASVSRKSQIPRKRLKEPKITM